MSVPENALAEVTFGSRPVGTTAWNRLGTDDNAPYRVFHDTSGLGVVVMRIDDTVGPDVDPALRGVLVVINAGATAVTQPVPGLAGAAFTLSAVQAAGADPLVKATTWDTASGTATVPARTVAVLVQR